MQYDYGFRIYDPRLVRFKSVDPLFRDYSALTPYQFASNNPIEGVDLDGKEYVSSKEVRIEVIRGVVYLKVENMSTVIKNALHDYNEDPKNWPAGSIGADFSIGNVNFVSMTPSFPTSDPEATDGNPNYRADQMEVGKATTQKGTTDKRYKDRSVTTASPSGAKGLAYLQIALMIVEKGVGIYIQSKSDYETSLINKHANSFKSAAADVNYALNNTTLIPPEFRTNEYLSDITNFVLSGESYLGKFDEGTGKKIKEIGTSIYNKYSVKRTELFYKTVEKSKLDGISFRSVEKTANPNYDAKYVKENPPL